MKELFERITVYIHYKTSNKTKHLQSKFMLLEQCAKFFDKNFKYQYALSMTFSLV